jgi:hypothetical protein
MIKSSILAATLAAVAAVGLIGGASAQSVEKTSGREPAKNVVLVHGAFVDGAG